MIDSSITGVVEKSHFGGFVDMKNKVYVKWDTPNIRSDGRKIVGETIEVKFLEKIC